MRASIAIAGIVHPLAQVTLRRDPESAELSAQLAGYWTIALGAACVLSVDGFADIAGTITESEPGKNVTRIVAAVAAASGTGEYAPARIQARGSDVVRADLDFGVLPGDTLEGLSIASVTSTMGASSPWFTEVRF